MSDVSTSAVAPCPPRFRVLTVCTGNLYRSPLAERLLRERLAAAGEVIQVSSAGTRAVPDARRPDEAARFTGEGGEGDGAVTRRLSAGLVQGADLVLGAATEHREAAVRLAPAWALSRAFSLREFARLV
ncbi:MAG TPA: protein-tyrosine-phosphatase, partial [Streptomyces sp.]|nr:protein-tyrosine-phosphatase [Streptomyces sp.]